VAKLRAIYRTMHPAGTQAQVAAAVAVREGAGGAAEFLLVRTSNGERWTFPKGHREQGETLAETARREAAEEAGVSGRVEPEPFAHYRYASGDGEPDLVAAFRLEVSGEARPAEERRDPAWFGHKAARRRLATGRDEEFAAEMERVLRAARRSPASC
jgi:8-oxo-dGTP pyrophosphatase MutT (NUDIX family)